MPLAMTLGMDSNNPLPIVTSLILSRNGNAITLSKQFYEQGVRNLKGLKRIISQSNERVYSLGVVHPSSMHNLMLRYWLASGGIDPDKDVNLVVLPPSQMVDRLKSGEIDGYCVYAPSNDTRYGQQHSTHIRAHHTP